MSRELLSLVSWKPALKASLLTQQMYKFKCHLCWLRLKWLGWCIFQSDWGVPAKKEADYCCTINQVSRGKAKTIKKWVHFLLWILFLKKKRDSTALEANCSLKVWERHCTQKDTMRLAWLCIFMLQITHSWPSKGCISVVAPGAALKCPLYKTLKLLFKCASSVQKWNCSRGLFDRSQ